MTGILVDTSTLILFYEDKLNAEAEDMLRQSTSKISIMTYFEIVRWLLKTERASERVQFTEKLKNTFTILPLSLSTCEHAAQIAHSHSFSTADSLIYATARHNELKLMSSDSDFKGKPGVIYVKPKS